MRMPPTTGFTIRIYPSTSTLLLAFAQLARGPLFLCCHAVEDIKFFCQQLKLVASAKQMGVSSYLFLLFPHNLFPTPLTKTGVSLAENFVCLILRGEADTITFHAWPIMASRMEVDTQTRSSSDLYK